MTLPTEIQMKETRIGFAMNGMMKSYQKGESYLIHQDITERCAYHFLNSKYAEEIRS